MRIDLDIAVSCADGAFGELADVVIDRGTLRLTHLVVVPRGGDRRPRLAAIEGARSAVGSEGISLACTVAELSESESIQQSAYVRPSELPGGGPDWDVGIQDIYPSPEYGSLGPEILGAAMTMEYDDHVAVSYHRVPKGGVELRRSSPITSSDGHHVGHVVGFVIDDDDQRVTELVLEHGHLWGKRTVVIPGPAIERFETDELTLGLTGDEVGDLKPLAAQHRVS
ncbi:MAG: PRC-barrel domain-containing protein [Solirubrobacteraceae bacterium]